MDAINTWTPWAKLIYFLCENVSRYLGFSLDTDLFGYLDIAAPLVQLITDSSLDHFKILFLSSQPSPHILFIFYTVVILQNYVSQKATTLLKTSNSSV